MTATRVVRVGGVPEHFNLPWRLAIEEGAFAGLDVEVEWIDFAGGTGAIMAALAEGEIEMATPLTEGAVTAIAKGNPSEIVRIWVDSPLLWGVHVAADSTLESLTDARGSRIAISRHGSGSELMGYVMGAELGWELGPDDFVLVGDLAGALAALPAGEAELFLWNKSMTQPHVDNGTFRRIAVVPTPWPSFAIVASNSMLSADAELVQSIADIAAERAATLAGSDATAQLVVERYGIDLKDAVAWLDQVRWEAPGAALSYAVIEAVEARMRALGRL